MLVVGCLAVSDNWFLSRVSFQALLFLGLVGCNIFKATAQPMRAAAGTKYPGHLSRVLDCCDDTACPHADCYHWRSGNSVVYLQGYRQPQR